MAVIECTTDLAQIYRVLELPFMLEPRQMKNQYRARVWELHPDVCLLPDAQGRFAELGQAWEAMDDRLPAPSRHVRLWDSARDLKRCFADLDPSRARAGIARRLIQLSAWSGLDLILSCLAETDQSLVWVGIHSALKLGALIPGMTMVRNWHRYLPACRLAGLRYAQNVLKDRPDHELWSLLALDTGLAGAMANQLRAG